MSIRARRRRGCLALLVLGVALMLGVGALLYGGVIARTAIASRAVLLDTSVLWVGDPCRYMRQQGLDLNCPYSYMLVARVRLTKKTYLLARGARVSKKGVPY